MTRDEYGSGLAHHLHAYSWALVGSTYIVGEGKDVDFLFYVPDLNEAAAFLHRKGCEAESEKYDDINQFMSFRTRHSDIGEVNILVTADPDFFYGFKQAAEVCKYLHGAGVTHMQSRAHRVKVHAIVRDGASA